MTIDELSNRMYLAFSTTTDLVDRMEKNELVVRIRDEKTAELYTFICSRRQTNNRRSNRTKDRTTYTNI